MTDVTGHTYDAVSIVSDMPLWIVYLSMFHACITFISLSLDVMSQLHLSSVLTTDTVLFLSVIFRFLLGVTLLSLPPLSCDRLYKRVLCMNTMRFVRRRIQ